MSIVGNPKILFLDEPTTGLGMHVCRCMYGLLVNYLLSICTTTTFIFDPLSIIFE
jgi:ABC-type multidrug transport system ATPase subunit